ncbi:MAG: nitrite reductase small subunit NirD [Ilumatobacteraceae bacterium]
MTGVEVALGLEPRVLGAWVEVCPLDRLTPDRGVCALVEGRQVAVFRMGDGAVHAVDNIDPCSGAAVLSRGIVGDAGGAATIASPLYKQRFELLTGRCLDADVPPLDVHATAVVDGVVLVRLASAP